MDESTMTTATVPLNNSIENEELNIIIKEELEELNIYEICYLNHYVEVYTYFSLYPLYGEVIEATPYMLVLDSKYIGKLDKSFNESSKFYLPLNSIISIKII